VNKYSSDIDNPINHHRSPMANRFLSRRATEGYGGGIENSSSLEMLPLMRSHFYVFATLGGPPVAHGNQLQSRR